MKLIQYATISVLCFILFSIFSGSAIASENKLDIPVIYQSLNTVLESYPVGKKLIWQNHATDNYGEIKATSKRQNNCRGYERSWVFNGGVTYYEGKACLNSDEVWKPVSEKRTHREGLTSTNDPLKAEQRRLKAQRDATLQKEIEIAKEKQRLVELERIAKQEQERQAAIDLQNKIKANDAAIKAKAVADALVAKQQADILRQQRDQEAEIERKRIAKKEEFERKKHKQWFEMAMAVLGVVAVIGLVGAAYFGLKRFKRGQYWQEHQQFKQLLLESADYKAIYFFIHDSGSLHGAKGYDYLRSLCVYEEHLESECQELMSLLNSNARESLDLTLISNASRSLASRVEAYERMSEALTYSSLIKGFLRFRAENTQWAKEKVSSYTGSLNQLRLLFVLLDLVHQSSELAGEADKRDQFLLGFGLDTMLESILDKEADFQTLDGVDETALSDLVMGLKTALCVDNTQLPAIEELADVYDDFDRINQIKQIIDLYNDKIESTEKEDIESDDKDESIDYLKRLRERDIAMLEGESI